MYLLFAVRRKRGRGEEKGCKVAKQGRMSAFAFSTCLYLLKRFAKSKRWITVVFLEADATLFAHSEPAVSWYHFAARRAVIYSLGDINSWITSFETFKAQHWVSVLSECVLADDGSQENSSCLLPPLNVGWWVASDLCLHLFGFAVSSLFCAPGMKQFLLCSCCEWHWMNCIILAKVTAGTG